MNKFILLIINREENIGSTLFRYMDVTSTNDVAQQLIAEKVARHGSVVVAAYQTQGRGQQQTSWQSDVNENVMVSIILLPNKLKAEDQAYLNIVMSLAVFDVVDAKFPDRTRIKWPNDIYVDNKKIAGILIENSLQGNLIKQSIVGIGLNVNQKKFGSPKATSMLLLDNEKREVDKTLYELLEHTEKRYRQLSSLPKEQLMDIFHNYLYRMGIDSTFRVGNEEIRGVIEGMDEYGRLKVRVNNKVRLFQNKEIELIG